MPLVIMGATRWPENIQLLPTLSSQAVASSKSSASSAHIPSKSNNNDVTMHRNNHVRRDSRPFDVLYESVPNNHKPPRLTGDLQAQYLTIASPSYLKIENTLKAGEIPNTSMKNSTAVPPVVTILSEKCPGRSSSIRSRQASLRRRHSKRNWMARKKDVISKPKNLLTTPELRIDSKRLSKIDFIFPTRRRTSFRYSPATSPRLSKFRSEKDIDDFFAVDDVAAAMKSLLPNTMNTFEFSKLKKLDPVLKIIPTRFDTSMRGKFISTGILTNDPLSQPPLVAHNSTFNTVSSQSQAISIGSNEKQKLLANAYSRYRSIASSTNAKIPAKIEALLPDLCEKLSPEEHLQLNTIFLLEILLRRTVAAKIQFRLRQNGKITQSFARSDDSGSSRSNLMLSKHSKLPESLFKDGPEKFVDLSSSSFNYNGNDEAAENRGKVSPANSDLLPSPQITSSSGVHNHFVAPEVFTGESPNSSIKMPATRQQNISLPTNSDSLGLGSRNGALDASQSTTKTSVGSQPLLAHNISGVSSKDLMQAETSGTSLQAGEMTLNAGVGHISLLRPLNVSTDTLSSSSTMPGNACFEIYQFCSANHQDTPNPVALLKDSSLGPKKLKPKSTDDQHDYSSAQSHCSSFHIDDASELREYSPEVDEVYFYPEFLKVSRPDATAQSLLPNADAVLRRQQSMKYDRKIGFEKREFYDTRSSSSSLFERKTVP